MNCYVAPLEGVTGYIYRNALHDYYGEGIDKYYTPFIVYHEKCILSDKDIREILPDNNKGQNLIPQVMTNKASDYLELEKAIMEYGYEEININIGCPSKTVISKKRGSGILGDMDMLDKMLDGIFEKNKANVSVKTRLGLYEPEDFYRILEIYNKYPIYELTIHPRIQSEFYKGHAHREYYKYASDNSKLKLCYNGDIRSVDDCNEIINELNPESVMLGRGLIGRPSLIREIKSGKASSDKEFLEFLGRLCDDYKSVLSGDMPVLYKMKEIWSFYKVETSQQEKTLKKLMKAKNIAEYKAYERSMIFDR